MSRPSLTSNEDAVRAMGLPETIAAHLGSPGREGILARMNAGIVRAVNLAIAQELDRGASSGDIHYGATRAIGTAITGLVYGVAGDRPLLVVLAGTIGDVAQASAENLALYRAGGSADFTEATVGTAPGRPA